MKDCARNSTTLRAPVVSVQIPLPVLESLQAVQGDLFALFVDTGRGRMGDGDGERDGAPVTRVTPCGDRSAHPHAELMMLVFGSMGTEITVSAPELSPTAEAGVAEKVAEIFAASERRFSRFRPDSELSRLNASSRPAVVSPALFDVLLRARRHFEVTGGLFDPTVGAALIAAGYDRSFFAGSLDRPSAGSPPRRATFGDVTLDAATRTVDKPGHVQLDLGGLVKGRTADVAAQILPSPGAVDAGGDAVLRGDGTSGIGWTVDVEDPFDPRQTLASFVVRDRAVATSGVRRRRWSAAGLPMHHLIDPRTSPPAVSDLVQVTVIGPTAKLAEVLAKAALLLGTREGARLLEGAGVTGAVLAGADGRIRRLGELEATNV